MAWLKVFQSIREHRKVLDAADALEIEPPYMIGLLTSFWLWALDNVKDGDVSMISPRNISRAAQWKGDPDKLLETFISAGFLDRPEHEPDKLFIHDWEDYAGSLIEGREKERERSKQRRAAAKATAKRPTDDQRTTEEQPEDDQQTTAGRVEKSRVEKSRDKDLICAPPEHEAATGSKSKADPVPYAKIMELYNEICQSFPKIQKIDGARRKAVAARFKTYPDLQTFEMLFRKTEASAFMRGANKTNWTADFDWIMKATNMCKVLEGKYDNNKGGPDNGNEPDNGSRYKLTGFTSAT